MDSHAHIYEYITGRQCTVKPFNDSYEPKQKVGIVNCAYVYDTDTGQTYILQVNNMLDFCHKMEDSILSTNQAREHGIVIDDIHPYVNFYQRSKFEIFEPNMNLHFLLTRTNKAINHLHVRHPTQDELDTFIHVHLTSTDKWNPTDVQISNITTSRGELLDSVYNDLAPKLTRQIWINAIHHTKQKK